MFLMSTGAQKLGQPVPESNLVFELKSGRPQQMQVYVPLAWLFAYLPVPAGSVALSRVTMYCSGVRILAHCSFVLTTRFGVSSVLSLSLPFAFSSCATPLGTSAVARTIAKAVAISPTFAANESRRAEGCASAIGTSRRSRDQDLTCRIPAMTRGPARRSRIVTRHHHSIKSGTVRP